MPLGKCFTAISVILMGCAAAVQAQNITTAQYINTYKNIAIEEERRTGIPAAITLAQGVVESQSGNCWLVLNSNNHFGIKCKNNWTGPYVTYDDDAKGECFRKYESAADSYKDHSSFLTGNPRYAFLFKYDQKDYKSWAYGLKQAGYATSPTYPQQLIKVIEDNNLGQYTLIALNEAPAGDGLITDPKAPASDRGTRGKDYAAGTSPIDKSNHTTYSSGKKNYPSGVFKVNGRKAIYVKGGTPLIQLASQYNVRLSNLVKDNDLEDDQTLPQDMLVFLQKKGKRGEDDYHLVAQGETMHDIAQSEGIQMKWLRRRNKMDEGQEPAPGAKLVLNGYASSKPDIRSDVAAAPLKEEDQQPKDLQPGKMWKDLKAGIASVRNGGTQSTTAATTTTATTAPATQTTQVNKLPAGMEDDLKKVAKVDKIQPQGNTGTTTQTTTTRTVTTTTPATAPVQQSKPMASAKTAKEDPGFIPGSGSTDQEEVVDVKAAEAEDARTAGGPAAAVPNTPATTAPANTPSANAPASNRPASNTPASATPASNAPASTPASTQPANTTPANTPATTTPAANTTSGTVDAEGYHEVLPKETLFGISQRFNVSISDLQAWNNLQGYDIKIGQRLLVRK